MSVQEKLYGTAAVIAGNSAVARFAWSSLTGATSVAVVPIGQYSAAIQPYVTAITGAGFDVGFVGVGAAPGGYDFYYQVIP